MRTDFWKTATFKGQTNEKKPEQKAEKEKPGRYDEKPQENFSFPLSPQSSLSVMMVVECQSRKKTSLKFT